MHKLILYRLLQFPLILAIIYLITFFLIWVAPGSPFEGERKLDPAAKRQLTSIRENRIVVEPPSAAPVPGAID